MADLQLCWDTFWSTGDFQNNLYSLNIALRDSLHDSSVANPVLTGNVMYAHLEKEFWTKPPNPKYATKRAKLILAARTAMKNSSCIEVGLNGGHSALILLTANPTINLVAVDVAKHLSDDWGRVDIYVPAAAQWLKRTFSERFTYIQGDSLQVLPDQLKLLPNLSVGLMHIDGAKENYTKDFKNCQTMLLHNSRIIFDDYNMPVVQKQIEMLLRSNENQMSIDSSIERLDSHMEQSQNFVCVFAANKALDSAFIEDQERAVREWQAKKRETTVTKKESLSGPGSSLSATSDVSRFLARIIQEYNIKSIVDLGCGDWHWMSKFSFPDNVIYTGYDLTSEIIDNNHTCYARANVCFKQANIITLKIPKCDLVICRDVLFHLHPDLTNKVLQNVTESGTRFLLLTNFNDQTHNAPLNEYNSISGWGFTNMNVFLAPYKLNAHLVESVREKNITGLPRYVILTQLNSEFTNAVAFSERVGQFERSKSPIASAKFVCYAPVCEEGKGSVLLNFFASNEQWKLVDSFVADTVDLMLILDTGKNDTVLHLLLGSNVDSLPNVICVPKCASKTWQDATAPRGYSWQIIDEEEIAIGYFCGRIWQYWENADKEQSMPATIQLCLETVQKNRGNYKLALVGKKDLSMLLPSQSFDFANMKIAQKVDIIRASLIYEFGGFWFDADCVYLDGIEDWMPKLAQHDFIGIQQNNNVPNSFFGAPRKSPFMYEVVKNIEMAVQNKDYTMRWTALGRDITTNLCDSKKYNCFLVPDIFPLHWNDWEEFFITDVAKINTYLNKWGNSKQRFVMLFNAMMSTKLQNMNRHDTLNEKNLLGALFRHALSLKYGVGFMLDD